MEMSRSRAIIPIFIPHRGCPHDCSFCNQKKIAGGEGDIGGREVNEIIDRQLRDLKNTDKIVEVAFYGGSFTGIGKEQQVDLLRVAKDKKDRGLIDEIRISTRPDYIDEEILDLLQAHGVSIIELGVQSTDREVLDLNNRGHSREDVFRASSLIRARQIGLGLQMMVGLYGDREDKLLNTAKDLIGARADFVRIYPTLVIENTLLEELYLKGLYKPISLEEAVYLCKKLLIKFREHNIPVIRLGLQATEEISIGRGLIAGPYHPAFRELVEAEIFKDLIEARLGSYDQLEGKLLRIFCNPRDSSKLAGHRQANRSYFKNKYNLGAIKICPSRDMAIGKIDIELLTYSW